MPGNEPCGACSAYTVAQCSCSCHWLERIGVLTVEVLEPHMNPHMAAPFFTVRLGLWEEHALVIQSYN